MTITTANERAERVSLLGLLPSCPSGYFMARSAEQKKNLRGCGCHRCGLGCGSVVLYGPSCGRQVREACLVLIRSGSRTAMKAARILAEGRLAPRRQARGTWLYCRGAARYIVTPYACEWCPVVLGGVPCSHRIAAAILSVKAEYIPHMSDVVTGMIRDLKEEQQR